MLASSRKPASTAVKLRVEALEKRYGAVTALRPTTLSVTSGEFVTLLGPSGSGKTTLLMLVAGLASPDGGEIWIDERQSTDMPAHQRDIGVVFQNYALFPHLSVFENIAFPLRMRRRKSADIERAVKRVLEIVDLPQMADRLPKELSGGQQQRVALARCAVYTPSIILMDEPLGALDKKLRDTMQMEIKRLHRELGSTILYVTHDQGEAMSMSDRICLMRDGGIEQLGTSQDLYFNPVSRFTGDFLGGTNFMPAVVKGRESEGGELILDASGGTVIRARTTGTAAAGEQVTFMVRPQHLTISVSLASGANVLAATIEETVMIGITTEYHARLADGTPIVAVELTSHAERRVQPGETVHLSWNTEHTVVFAGKAAL